VQAAEQ